jgi:hypothetical protein
VARTLLGGGYGCKGNDGDSDSASQNDAVVGVSQNDAVVGVSQNDAVVGRGGVARWWGEAEWRFEDMAKPRRWWAGGVCFRRRVGLACPKVRLGHAIWE